MSTHADLGECTRCHERHCIEGVASETGALYLLCYHHGLQVEADVRAKVCTDCGYVEFWARTPSALKLRPPVAQALDAERSVAIGDTEW